MRWLVLPPHRDFTLQVEAPAGWQVLDVGRQFVDSLEAPGLLAREAAARLEEGALEAALQLQVAEVLLSRPGLPWHSRLRALGAALAGVSRPGGVQLRLDDLELPDGTTESSADLLRGLARPAPYDAALEAALAALVGASAVRLRLTQDQQLPAALALASRLPGAVPLELSGSFAAAHAQVLGRMPPFARAVLAPDDEVIERAGGLRWGEGPGAWGGPVSLERLCAPHALADAGCQLAVIAFCGIHGGEVLATDGSSVSLEALRSAHAALRVRGVRVVAEWWVGAPGLSEAAHLASERAFQTAPFLDWLAGVRTYHGGREHAPERFGGVPVRWLAPPSGHDLARNRPFEAAGSVTGGALRSLQIALAQRLMALAPASPGRVAGAYAIPSEVPSVPPREGPLTLDRDCAVVQMPSKLSGEGAPTWYAANLRTGSVFALDARLAPTLAGLRGPAPAAEVLPLVPEEKREAALQALISRGLLERVHG